MHNIEITLNKPDHKYFSGEILQGSVIVDAPRDLEVRSVYVTVEGEANVFWEERQSYRDNYGTSQERSIRYSSQEQYIKSKSVLFGQFGGPPITYPEGPQLYSFSCTLPSQLPETLNTFNATIDYKVRVVIEIPRETERSKTQGFIVRKLVDLNEFSSLKLPVVVEDTKYFYRLNCSRQKAVVSASVPQGGFVPEQEIPISVHIINSTKVQIEAIDVKLMRKVKLTANFPRYKDKEESFVVSKTEVAFIEDTREAVTKITRLLRVPLECPVTCQTAMNIRTEYFLGITFRVQGCHLNKHLQLPIEIGTIPIRGGVPGGQTEGFPIMPENTIPPTAPMPIWIAEQPSAPPAELMEKNTHDLPPSYEQVTDSKRSQEREGSEIGWKLK